MDAAELKQEKLVTLAVGLVSLSVCVPKDLAREEIEAEANREHPTGISSRWAISDEPHFATGHANPCTCQLDQERQHWLLHC